MHLWQKIRAARAALSWSQSDLAEKSGVGESTINRIEDDKYAGEPNERTVSRIVLAFTKSGIDITGEGVRPLPPIYTYNGDSWFLDLIEDIRGTLKRGNVLRAENIDDRKSNDNVKAGIQMLLENGIKLRMTSSDDNPVMLYDPSWYRHIPARYYRNQIILIYGDKVAISTEAQGGCVIVRDADLADAMANRFDMVWEMLNV